MASAMPAEPMSHYEPERDRFTVEEWLAHALEEYGRAKPLRPRAIYVGPPPPSKPL